MPLLSPDSSLQNLAVEGFLGDGGVAEVYRVRRGGEPFALKLARPGLEVELQREVASPNVVEG